MDELTAPNFSVNSTVARVVDNRIICFRLYIHKYCGHVCSSHVSKWPVSFFEQLLLTDLQDQQIYLHSIFVCLTVKANRVYFLPLLLVLCALRIRGRRFNGKKFEHVTSNRFNTQKNASSVPTTIPTTAATTVFDAAAKAFMHRQHYRCKPCAALSCRRCCPEDLYTVC